MNDTMVVFNLIFAIYGISATLLIFAIYSISADLLSSCTTANGEENSARADDGGLDEADWNGDLVIVPLNMEVVERMSREWMWDMACAGEGSICILSSAISALVRASFAS